MGRTNVGKIIRFMEVQILFQSYGILDRKKWMLLFLKISSYGEHDACKFEGTEMSIELISNTYHISAGIGVIPVGKVG